MSKTKKHIIGGIVAIVISGVLANYASADDVMGVWFAMQCVVFVVGGTVTLAVAIIDGPL